MQVPSAGIFTNETGYLFYKCQYDPQPALVCSKFMGVELQEGICAHQSREAVMNVLQTMVQLFLDQQEALRNFWAQEAAQ